MHTCLYTDTTCTHRRNAFLTSTHHRPERTRSERRCEDWRNVRSWVLTTWADSSDCATVPIVRARQHHAYTRTSDSCPRLPKHRKRQKGIDLHTIWYSKHFNKVGGPLYSSIPKNGSEGIDEWTGWCRTRHHLILITSAEFLSSLTGSSLASSTLCHLYLLLLLCLCVTCVGLCWLSGCHMAYVYIRRHICRVGSLLLPICGYQGRTQVVRLCGKYFAHWAILLAP